MYTSQVACPPRAPAITHLRTRGTPDHQRQDTGDLLLNSLLSPLPSVVVVVVVVTPRK